MTEEGKFTSIEDFRRSATEEDYERLWEYLQANKGDKKAFKSKDTPVPDGPYLFSESAARQAIKKHDEEKKAAQEQQPALEEQHEQAAPVPAKEESGKLRIRYGKKGFSKRSVMIANDNWVLLQEVCGKYEGANKHYVLDALLAEILAKYK